MTAAAALRIAVTALSVAVGLCAVEAVSTAVSAPVKTIKVCVNKKTGEAQQLRKGKCRRGWKKISWSSQGPTGLPGAPGSPGSPGARGPAGTLSLYANGRRVAPIVGSPENELYFPAVLLDGGLYGFLPDGSLYPNIESPTFRAADCSGTAFFVSSEESQARLQASWAGSNTRLVARTTSPVLGAIQGVWVPSGQIAPLAPGGENLYRRTSTGECVGPAMQTGWTATLTPVTPPGNLTPPLTVR